jgi:hypothetical protein
MQTILSARKKMVSPDRSEDIAKQKKIRCNGLQRVFLSISQSACFLSYPKKEPTE